MLKQQIQEDMKTALKASDKRRLGVVRLILAAIKQREVDERIELSDQQVLVVLDKMIKQRRDSMNQFQQAGRADLAGQEEFEITICQNYLPKALEPAEITALIDSAIAATGALVPKDMAKVMAWLKPHIQGRADAGNVSTQVKMRLST